ncbi:MAG: NAD(P)/FAD-dependent oxidoreductase [Acetobacteraceae bacterium]
MAGEYDVVIVGGGIGGLSAAWMLRERRILVLEAGRRAGGRIYSESRGDYWLNFGAHLFGEATSPVGRLVAELGLDARPIPGDRMGLYFNGTLVTNRRPESLPLRLPLSLQARLSLVKMGLRLRAGVRRIMNAEKAGTDEAPAERRMKRLSFENQRTLDQYMGRLHPDAALILRTITERTGASPEVMAAGYGLNSFTQVWSRHSLGRNLFGGSAGLPEAIAGKLGERIVLGATVSSVKASANEVEIRYRRDGEDHRAVARYAVVATEADVARDIIEELPKGTADALNRIRYGPFLSAAVLTGEAGPMPWDHTYAIATPGLSFGVFFNQASSLRVGTRRPGGSLMLFTGALGAARLMSLSERGIERHFLADLGKLFPETRGIAREIRVQRWPKGAPYSFPGRAALQPALTSPLGRVYLAGDYLEFPSMEAAVRSGSEAAERIAEELRKNT